MVSFLSLAMHTFDFWLKFDILHKKGEFLNGKKEHPKSKVIKRSGL